MVSPGGSESCQLSCEKVAYWYLRLNGFLQIENFYIHPVRRGAARTDADLLAVRFPYRKERLYDTPDDIMQDDSGGLSLSSDRIDVVIAEVKRSRCALNGPWTNPSGENVHRVLAAIGCLPPAKIRCAAKQIYETGLYDDGNRLRIRLIAIGNHIDDLLQQKYPRVTQIVWEHLLRFVFDRFQKYRNQKTQTDHWDNVGKQLKERATRPHRTCDAFVKDVTQAMGLLAR
ncbi:hypothetical protein [Elioraea tepidiphila]|uniref:hypothetical protein n=1 Tax=Elioraea tepidiphila TaxID=457934 RepID=UPI000365C314|nr:hypothetical protein [Elioraea tepidiphila]